MYEIFVEEGGRERHRQQLPEGSLRLGRLAENDIAIADNNISRHHLQLEVAGDEVMVKDLGSTNGAQIEGRQLIPHQLTRWFPGAKLTIGPLTLRLQPASDGAAGPPAPAEPAFSGPTVPPVAPTGAALTIVCAQAVPPLYRLAGAAIIGRDPSAAIRVIAGPVAAHHCQVMLAGGRVMVTNLDQAHPAQLANGPLPVGQPHPWEIGQPLRIGAATFYLSATAAAAAIPVPTTRRRGRAWQVAVVGLFLALFAFVCVAVASVVGAQRAGCDGLDPRCVLAVLDVQPAPTATPGPSGPATPTLAPFNTAAATPTRPTIITLQPETPSPTPVVSCEVISDAITGAGWLDIPFPYDGNQEHFRRISQRSRAGGRINSFFDHEYPLYPPSWVIGLETVELAQTLVIFDGSRSLDAAQDRSSGDYYSGHSGIDYSPESGARDSTPVYAAAAGNLYSAVIDFDGNHMIQIEHDPDGDGRNKYLTLYFHLKEDEFYAAMLAKEQLRQAGEVVPIAAGERIGTMGTTGQSTGIHLHFEVRYDADNNRRYNSFERVDPYGFFPTEAVPEDPWSLPATWVDSRGQEHTHAGVMSQYLWKHPLVDVEVEAGESLCVAEVSVQVDLYPLLGWTVVDPGFTHIIRDEQDQVVDVGPPEFRQLTILPEDLLNVQLSTLSLEFLPPGGDAERDWETVPASQTELDSRPGGGFFFSAQISRTGRYVLVGRQSRDVVAPYTEIDLVGERGELPNTFIDSVQVTLEGHDLGFPDESGIALIEYSLDCGRTFQPYSDPFTVTLQTPHNCGQSGSSELGVLAGPNDFMLLAIATDSNNNIQEPASQVIFSIQ
jgi:murein DD-endopeptidase MepM/ murein hydrolase activator NlpD